MSKGSQEALKNATTSRANFSGRGRSKGAAGYVNPNDVTGNYDFVKRSGDAQSISPPEGGFTKIKIGAAWDNVYIEESKLFGLIKTKKKANIDLDLGCLYELHDGTRGAIQAFGELYGYLKKAPYIRLSGDERTGDSEGDDEFMIINGKKWSEIKRILVYVYIYEGALDWAQAKPQIQIRVPKEPPIVVTLSAHMKELGLCVIAELENVRNGIVVTNYTEYFPGHDEMDRAYGFGLEWDDGEKSPA
ncbi:MAG: TerD family protein [Alphaproteobacteria bacterium]|nr:TerD family protein [Alphaproteobacteria bacterium]